MRHQEKTEREGERETRTHGNDRKGRRERERHKERRELEKGEWTEEKAIERYIYMNYGKNQELKIREKNTRIQKIKE